MKVSGALMNMILVIISAFVANVAAYAQLSTELEQSYSVTSQQAVKATAEKTDLEQLSIFNQSTAQKIFCTTFFNVYPYLETRTYHVGYQARQTVKFNKAKQVFININDKTS